ncbi:MAG TPA: RNA-binding domain-containing protein [Longimicrobium sp.]|nr:RNA-binding domain-containing protein [Longimicrobium sp.]
MYFKRLVATNFGPFEKVDLLLHRLGVNVITGPNASGKTQLKGAIIAAVLGETALNIDDEGISPSTISLEIGEDEYTEITKIEISAVPGRRPVITRSVESTPSNSTPRALNLQLLSVLSNPHGPRLFLGDDVLQGELTGADPRQWEEVLPESIRNADVWAQLRKSGLLNEIRSSGGVRLLARMIRELVVRRSTNSSLPFIVDDGLLALGQESQAFAFHVLEVIGESAQVLYLTSFPNFPKGILIKKLDFSTSFHRSLASYNQSVERQQPNLAPRRQAHFVKGQRYPVQETRTCELKEVKGQNPLGSIKNVVDQYAVAFLNAGQPQEGSIVWGVRDEDLSIVGVHLTPSDCDTLRRVVTEKLLQITPPLAPTAYRVELHSVSDGENIIPDLYVVEIRIPASRRGFLFSTGSQEVYVKTDAGKKKLTALELQQELIRRWGLDPVL